MAATDSVWMYQPSVPLAILGAVLYGILFIAISYFTFLKYRAWYFSAVVAGAALEVAGYALRAYSTKNQTELAPFVMTLTFTVIAPIFVAAGNYLLISRLILCVLPPSRHRVLKMPGRHLTPIFVVCDVVACIVQSSGSGIASSDNWTGSTERVGRYVLTGGLAFQTLSFCFFLTVFARFHYLANQREAECAPKNWRRLLIAVYTSSFLILIRCIYRMCEFAEGMDGYAFRTEWLFWVFEALPMIGAIGIFCMYHPSNYLPNKMNRIQETKHAINIGSSGGMP